MLKRLKDAASSFGNTVSSVVSKGDAAQPAPVEASQNEQAAEEQGSGSTSLVGQFVDAATGVMQDAAVAVGGAIDSAIEKADDVSRGHLVGTTNTVLDIADTGAELYRGAKQVPYLGTAIDYATGERGARLLFSAASDTLDELDRKADGTMPAPIADAVQNATGIVRTIVNQSVAETIAKKVGKKKKPKKKSIDL